MKSSSSKYFFFVLLLAAAVTAPAQLVNGNFAAGDFTGWTLFNTQHGGSAITPQVVQFDTAGTGAPVNSAEFEAGETSGTIGGGGLGQGAGLYQYVALGAGQLDISLDIAAFDMSDLNNVANADAGTFELLLDGNLVASHAFGSISLSQTERSALSYSGMVAAGTHEILIDMRRGYGTLGGDTPYQYLANVSLSVTPAPEPGVLGLLALSGLFLGSMLPFRRRGQF
jgi:hypothetical protein